MEFISEYIKKNICDPWSGTIFAGYKFLNTKQKGILGELYLENIIKELNIPISNAVNSGHDRVIDNKKVEFKFSLSITDSKTQKIKDKVFMLNHVSIGKDWDILIFAGIQKDLTPIIKYITKEDFISCLKNENYFSFQQGGSTVENDDYMCSGSKLLLLLNSKYMRDLTEWT